MFIMHSTDHRPTIDRPSTDHRPTIDRLSTDHRPTIDRPSTDYRPTIDRLSTDCRPTIDQLSTAISTDCRPLYRPLCRPICQSTLPTVNKIRYLLASHCSACKYDLSVHGTYFECEGVKCTYFNFAWWPCKRSYFKEAKVHGQVWSTPLLKAHLINRK